MPRGLFRAVARPPPRRRRGRDATPPPPQVDQARLFAGGGVEFSVDVASPEALIPLLRDAVATATTRRTCAHLAVPVDVQAAKAPLPLKSFCAATAPDRIQPSGLDARAIARVAARVKGSRRVVVSAEINLFGNVRCLSRPEDN